MINSDPQRISTEITFIMVHTFNHSVNSPNQIPVGSFVLKTWGQIHQLTAVDPTPLVDPQSLQHLEQDSLGQALIAHLEHHQIQPFTFGPRRLQLHDTVHVLTGYGVDLLGEIEVQAFLCGCKFRLGQIVLGLGLLSKLWRNSDQHPDHDLIWQRIQIAHQRGQQSRFDPDDWSPQDRWHQPLEQVRESLGIPPQVQDLS